MVYTVRNKVPDPSVSYTELGYPRHVCAVLVMGTTKLHVFDEASNKCRVYTTIVPEEDLIDADRFTAFYHLTGRGPGMTCVN